MLSAAAEPGLTGLGWRYLEGPTGTTTATDPVWRRKLGGGFAAVLALVVAVVLATTSVAPWAAAKPAPPPPPGSTSPPGPDSTFYFNAYGPSPNDDVLLRWDQETLNAIRLARSAPTAAARALAVVHTATYDAWAPYDPVAVDTRGRLRAQPSLRRPAAERTVNYKSMAISHGANRVLLDLFPAQLSNLVSFMDGLGYDPDDTSTDPALPQGIGNLAAQAVLAYRHGDGSNQLGDLNGGAPYSDWTGYTPQNSWDTLDAPLHWQPLCVPLPSPGATSCTGSIQRFSTPHWGQVTPFALTRLFAAADSRAAAMSLDANVKVFFALGNAVLDASIATWNAKAIQDTVRPTAPSRGPPARSSAALPAPKPSRRPCW